MRVSFYAGLSDIVGQKEVEVKFSGTVCDILDRLCREYGGAESPLPASRCGGRGRIWAVIGLLSRIQCKPIAQLVGAEFPIHADGRSGYTVVAPLETTGIGTALPNSDRSCVFTITITAPQHAHRMGGRFLNQGNA